MKTRPTVDYEQGAKHCSFCKEWLPFANFGVSLHKNGGCGLRSYCKACARIRYPKPRLAEPKRTRKEHIFDIHTRLELRECSKCSLWLGLSEFFVHGRFLSNLCKPCERERARLDAREHADRHRESTRVYAAANPEKVRAGLAKWRSANPERLAAHNRSPKKQAQNREYMRQKTASGEARAYRREYARRYPEKGAEKAARRRAIIAGVTVEPVSRTAIIERDGRWCYLCGVFLKWREVTLDHVIPLVRGGAHIASNLRVACSVCNSRKGGKTLEEYDAYLQIAQSPEPVASVQQTPLPLFAQSVVLSASGTALSA